MNGLLTQSRLFERHRIPLRATLPSEETVLPEQTGLSNLLRLSRRIIEARAVLAVRYGARPGQHEELGSVPANGSAAPVAADFARLIGQEMLESLPVGNTLWVEPSDDADTLVLAVKFNEQKNSSDWLLFVVADHAAAGIAAPDEALADLVSLARSLVSTRGKLVDAHRQASALMSALNQSECGTVLLRRDHTVLFSNRAAERLFEDGSIVHLSRGLLRLHSYQDTIRLEAALDNVIAQSQGRRGRGMVMLLRRPDRERAAIAVVAPLPVENGGPEDAAAIIYLMQPDQSPARGLEPICELHGLSPVETRLVTHLIGGLTVSDAATKMRIKPDTARAYLKQVFLKTSTNRQSSLVRLITRYQRAIRGDFDFQTA